MDHRANCTLTGRQWTRKMRSRWGDKSSESIKRRAHYIGLAVLINYRGKRAERNKSQLPHIHTPRGKNKRRFLKRKRLSVAGKEEDEKERVASLFCFRYFARVCMCVCGRRFFWRKENAETRTLTVQDETESVSAPLKRACRRLFITSPCARTQKTPFSMHPSRQ